MPEDRLFNLLKQIVERQHSGSRIAAHALPLNFRNYFWVPLPWFFFATLGEGTTPWPNALASFTKSL
jgi:hypothetical protein